MTIGTFELTMMTASSLDAAFDAAFKANNDQALLAQLGTEIASRLATPWAFITGTIGIDNFPLYAADLGVMPQNTSAQTAVTTSANNAIDTVKNLASNLLLSNPVLIIGGIAAVVFYFVYVKGKK